MREKRSATFRFRGARAQRYLHPTPVICLLLRLSKAVLAPAETFSTLLAIPLASRPEQKPPRRFPVPEFARSRCHASSAATGRSCAASARPARPTITITITVLLLLYYYRYYYYYYYPSGFSQVVILLLLE